MSVYTLLPGAQWLAISYSPWRYGWLYRSPLATRLWPARACSFGAELACYWASSCIAGWRYLPAVPAGVQLPGCPGACSGPALFDAFMAVRRPSRKPSGIKTLTRSPPPTGGGTSPAATSAPPALPGSEIRGGYIQELPPALDAELAENVPHVRLDGVDGEVELLRDLAVGPARPGQPGYRGLLRRELIRRRLAPAARPPPLGPRPLGVPRRAAALGQLGRLGQHRPGLRMLAMPGEERAVMGERPGPRERLGKAVGLGQRTGVVGGGLAGITAHVGEAGPGDRGHHGRPAARERWAAVLQPLDDGLGAVRPAAAQVGVDRVLGVVDVAGIGDAVAGQQRSQAVEGLARGAGVASPVRQLPRLPEPAQPTHAVRAGEEGVEVQESDAASLRRRQGLGEQQFGVGKA